MVNLSINELKLITKTRGIKGYERISEDRLLSALNESEPLKTIREIRKKNRDEDKIFRDLNFLFEPQSIIMNLKKVLVLLIIAIFNMKVWEIRKKNYQSKNTFMLSDHI